MTVSSTQGHVDLTGEGGRKFWITLYYVSSNSFLFDRAITISSIEDLNNFMRKVINLDLATNYYLKKPSSSWVLAGLTNVQICIYKLDVPTILS